MLWDSWFSRYNSNLIHQQQWSYITTCDPYMPSEECAGEGKCDVRILDHEGYTMRAYEWAVKGTFQVVMGCPDNNSRNVRSVSEDDVQ